MDNHGKSHIQEPPEIGNRSLPSTSIVGYSQRKHQNKHHFPLRIEYILVYLQRIYGRIQFLIPLGKVSRDKRTIHLVMVTTNGVTYNNYYNIVQNEVTMDQLFRI